MKKIVIKRNMPGTEIFLPGELKIISQASFQAAGQAANPYKLSRLALVICPLILFLVLLSGCKKEQPEIKAKAPVTITEDLTLNSDDQFQNAYKEDIQSTESNDISANRSLLGHGFSFITFLELLEARAATAKYRVFDTAIAHGYADINVVVPNMGYHFMKSAIVDAKFEVRKPEILVYNKRLNGSFELLAVEYAVPISVTPDVAPEGFTGSADVWERNTDFGLWLQHAWIWRFNPAGVFNDTNPLVHVR